MGISFKYTVKKKKAKGKGKEIRYTSIDTGDKQETKL